MNPDPKPVTIRLKGKAYTDFRKQVAKRAMNCCEECGKYVPLSVCGCFDQFLCGHVSHIKSKGAGGQDLMSNVQYLCFSCHRAKHDGK